jgi:starch-binding outer membrane protein, SusD/RagB family
MKNTIISGFFLSMAFVSLLTSCNDKLNVDSTYLVSEDAYYTSYANTRSATAALYSSPWAVFENYFDVYYGDLRAGNCLGKLTNVGTNSTMDYIFWNTTSLASQMADGWNSLYAVVAQSSNVIVSMERSEEKNPNFCGTEENLRICYGEARFMRAVAYWYLADIWHDVPIIEDPQNYTLNFQSIAPSPYEDVLEYAARDLRYAAQYLPDDETAGEGAACSRRLTKASAYGMLSRIYCSMAAYARGGWFSNSLSSSASSSTTKNQNPHKSEYYTYYAALSGLGVSTDAELGKALYKLALDAADRCIAYADAGSYSLLSDYEDISLVGHKQTEELFALQYAIGWETYSYGGNRKQSSWGCYNQYLVNGLFGTNGNAYYVSLSALGDMLTPNTPDSTDTNGHTVMVGAGESGVGRVYGSLFTKGEYYDRLANGMVQLSGIYGSTSNSIGVQIRKFMVGIQADTGYPVYQYNSGLSHPMLRLADVYLMRIEANMGLNDATYTSDAADIKLFNKIRGRAGGDLIDEQSGSISFSTLLKERRMEFLWEALYMHDLLRYSFYNFTDAKQLLVSQDCYSGYICVGNRGDSTLSTPTEAKYTITTDGYSYTGLGDNRRSITNWTFWRLDYPKESSDINTYLTSSPKNGDYQTVGIGGLKYHSFDWSSQFNAD